MKAYREDSDIIGQFVQERLEPATDSQTRLAVVYQAYQAWCWQNGYVPVSNKNLRRSWTGMPPRGALLQVLSLWESK